MTKQESFKLLAEMVKELDEENHLEERGLLGVVIYGIINGLELSREKKIDVVEGMKYYFGEGEVFQNE